MGQPIGKAKLSRYTWLYVLACLVRTVLFEFQLVRQLITQLVQIAGHRHAAAAAAAAAAAGQSDFGAREVIPQIIFIIDRYYCR